MAEQSIMLNPDPIVQASANGFALNVAMNQTKEDKQAHGMIQDYHILPELLTFPRRVAMIEAEKEIKEEKKKEVLTKDNSFMVNLMLQDLKD